MFMFTSFHISTTVPKREVPGIQQDTNSTLLCLCANMLKCVRKSTVLQLDGEGGAFAFLTIDSDGATMF